MKKQSFFGSTVIFFVAIVTVCFLAPQAAFGILIFDNGPVDSTRTTWNDTDPSYTIYDDFVLSSPTEITGLTHSIFMQNSTDYVQTFVSIFDGIGTTANPIIPEFSTIGTLSPNGLTTSNANVPNGFDVQIDGLSLLLGQGSYFIGIRTDVLGGLLAAIGSGPGSAQTIGPGLFQALGSSPASGGSTRIGDHMAFKIISDTTPVPEPTTIMLLGIGLTGLAGMGRKKFFKK